MLKNLNVLSIFIIFVYLLSYANTRVCFVKPKVDKVDCNAVCTCKDDCHNGSYEDDKDNPTYATCNNDYTICFANAGRVTENWRRCSNNLENCMINACLAACGGEDCECNKDEGIDE